MIEMSTSSSHRPSLTITHPPYPIFFFFFNHPAPTEIYTLSLYDALPICLRDGRAWPPPRRDRRARSGSRRRRPRRRTRSPSSAGWRTARSEEHTSELQSLAYLVCRLLLEKKNMEVGRYGESNDRDVDIILAPTLSNHHSSTLPYLLFFFQSSGPHRDLHSFPIRRSSDLSPGRKSMAATPPRPSSSKRIEEAAPS